MRKILIFVFSFFCFVIGANQTLDAQNKNKLDAYKKYATGIFKHYDLDQDSLLSQSEIEKMRRPALMSADSNSDGKISKDEFVESITSRVRKSGKTVKLAQAQPSQTVFVQLDLFEVSMDSEVDEFKKNVDKLNDDDVDVQELINKLRKNKNIERTGFFSFEAQTGKEIELTERSAENGIACMFKTTVKRISPSVEMSVNFQRSRPVESETGVDSNSVKKTPDMSMITGTISKEALGQLILAKVRAKEQQSKSLGKSTSQRTSGIQIGATVDCGSNGVTTFHFANGISTACW